MLRIIESRDRAGMQRVLGGSDARDRSLDRRVAAIIGAVRTQGDRAVSSYARRLDGLTGPIELSADQIREGAREASRDVRSALASAARRIRAVARKQVPRGWRVSTEPGVQVEQRVVPLDRVGCYVPGGRYPLPSSLLMTAIPAAAAGVPEIVVACPRPEPAVLAAAVEAGVTRLFRIGGAHAIAALAYGTETIPRVDKIVGPGNRYVATAKAQIAADCAIDFYAGPTEILILSEKGPAEWVAADLIAQAEHDPDARAVLITTSRRLAASVARAVAAQMPANGPAAQALERHGAVVVAGSRAEATELANQIAPEHLVCDDEHTARGIRCAGAIFIGRHTAQVAGDYAIGSNHVLPTSRAARFRGGLSAADFVRVQSVQRVTRQGLRRLAPDVFALARAEGLNAHAASVEVRLT